MQGCYIFMQPFIHCACQLLNNLPQMKQFLTLSLLSLFFFASCKKEAVPENRTIVGKWKLTQTNSSYVNGGDFLWRNTPSNYSKQIEFFASGNFEEQNNLGGSPQACTGSWRILTGNTLEKNSSCQTVTETLTISEQTSTVLVIDYHAIEGVYKEKYVPTR